MLSKRESQTRGELVHVSKKKLHNFLLLPTQCSEHTQLQLEAAQRELQMMMEDRDDALLQMTNAQEQAKQNATALRNLQAVLEEFQRGE